MTITERILNTFGFISEKQFNLKLSDAIKSELDRNIPLWLGETADAARWIMPDISVFATQADMYRLSPILGTAVNILGNDIGTSKINIKRMVGEETRDIPNHEFELLLRNPNPANSGIELIQHTTSSYILNGNAIWWLNKAGESSTVDEIWPIPFSMITPIPDKQMYVSYYEYYPGNGKTPMQLETWEICHFKTYNPNNRFVGLSPLESLAVTLQGDLAMRKTNTVTYAEYGGAPQSILSFKEYVQEPAWSNVKQEVREAAKRNEMMMLRGVGDGVSWLQRAMSAKDADFINGLKQNMTDVFNRVCPGLISMLSENATEANALAARATYSEKTQWPIMEVISQKITSDILPAYGRKLIAVFDDPRVVDKKLKLEEQTAYERTHTIDEIRKEYYQDEPLEDERGEMLPAQVTASSGGTQPEPQPAVEPPAEDAPIMPEDESEDVTEPVKADLMRWKRYAMRTFGTADFDKFQGTHTPEHTARVIRAKLTACKTKADVADVFETSLPVQPDTIFYLAKVIEKAVNAK